MGDEILHILKSRINRNSSLYLILIPILVYVVVLTLVVSAFNTPAVRTKVLGTDSVRLDKAAQDSPEY